ncbi:MAG: hypothetical protein R8P61_30465 [Bacteroidia bacterium]|nr:hypothetical protein [Bacteroidia bacterium]
MEDKSRQELEDLLIEAREESLHSRITRVNLRIILIMGILVIANVIMFPYDFARDNPDDTDGFIVGMVLQAFLIPIISLLLALIVSIFRFAPWSYLKRLYRSFLLFGLVLSVLLSTVLILSLSGIIS